MGVCFSGDTSAPPCRNRACRNAAGNRTQGYCNACYHNLLYQKSNYNRTADYRSAVNTNSTLNNPGFHLGSSPNNSIPPYSSSNAPNQLPPPPSYEAAMKPQPPTQQSSTRTQPPIPPGQNLIQCPVCTRKLLVPCTLSLARCPYCERAFEVERDMNGEVFTAIVIDEEDVRRRRAYDSYYNDVDRYGNTSYGGYGGRSSGAGTGTMLAAGGAGLLGGLLFAGALDAMF